MGEDLGGGDDKIISPSPLPSPPRGEGKPFITPAEPGGILAHYDKTSSLQLVIFKEDSDKEVRGQSRNLQRPFQLLQNNHFVIVSHFRIQGTPVPTNDVRIGASAMQHGLKVLTTHKYYLEILQIITEYHEAS